jgi:hypothetical protein
MQAMIKDHLEGKPVYVRFLGTYERKRKGSIALIKEVRNLDYLVNGHRYYRSTGTVKYAPFKAGDVNPANLNSSVDISCKWTGRTNRCNPGGYEVEWLKDYVGETHWVFEQPEEDYKQALDRLDREIKVGDFICYVLHHFGGDKGATACFGNVTKVTRGGEVWAKNIKLTDKEVIEEKRILHNSNITILTKDLMDQLMLAKLRSI